MNRYFILLIAILAITLIGCAPQTPTDPAAVMDAYTAAINAHDVEAALALVAEDAAYDRPGGQYQGKEEIRGFIESLFARNVKVELVGERTVNGNTVTWVSQVTLDDPENPGGPQIVLINNSESIVENGLIVYHTARRPE